MRFLNLLLAFAVFVSMTAFTEKSFAQKSATKKVDMANKAQGKRKGNRLKSLQLLSFEQLAQLPHRQRVQYLKTMTEAVMNLDKFQRTFDKIKTASNDKSYDKYAMLYDAAELLLPTADAQAKLECLFGGNVSDYPTQGRDAFRCKEVTCSYSGGARQDGILCDYTVFGGPNLPDVGCIPGAAKYKATALCEANRKDLVSSRQADIKKVLSESAEFFGLPINPNEKGTFNYKEGFDSQKAKNLISDLLSMSYDYGVRAQMIKVVHFYNKSGRCIPQDLPIMSKTDKKGRDEMLATLGAIPDEPCGLESKVVDSLHDLNKAVERMYKRYNAHCDKNFEANPEVVAGVVDGSALRKVPEGGPQWQAEKDRQAAVLRVCGASDLKNVDVASCSKKVTRRNMFEIPECLALEESYRETLVATNRVNGPGPGDSTLPPPPVPVDDIDPNDRSASFERTGCNVDNVTVADSKLNQTASRCMACIVQKYEEKKNPDPDAMIMPMSFKFESLVSTMALACGDGRIENSTLTPEARLAYWNAFGHCGADKYDWLPQDEKYDADIRNWNSEMSQLRDKGSWLDNWKNRSRNNANHPDNKGKFKDVYGISFEGAAKLFCPEDRLKLTFFTRRPKELRKDADWVRDQDLLNRMQRQQFGKAYKELKDKKGDEVKGYLMECMDQALKVTEGLHRGSDVCIGTAPLHSGFTTPEKFKTDAPVIMARASCYVPAAIVRSKTNAQGAFCSDANNDNKSDKTGAACSGPMKTHYMYMDPSARKNADGTTADGKKWYNPALGSGDPTPDHSILADSDPKLGALAEFSTYSGDACPVSVAEAAAAARGERIASKSEVRRAVKDAKADE
jgi:hypothetical protein